MDKSKQSENNFCEFFLTNLRSVCLRPLCLGALNFGLFEVNDTRGLKVLEMAQKKHMELSIVY